MRKKLATTNEFSRSLEFLGDDIPTTTRLEKSQNSRSKRINQYRRGPRIGKGRHGEVFLGQDTLNSNRLVAIKVVKRSNPKDKIKLLRRNYQQTDGSTRNALNSTENSVRREIAVMKRCRHPNLASLQEVVDDPTHDKIYLVLEYIAGGAIEWEAEKQPLLTLAQTRRIMRDVILGLEFMHSKGILHRDVKPSNIVYGENRNHVKLIDFGIAHIMLPPVPKRKAAMSVDSASPQVELAELFPASDLMKRTGTPSFLAPEVVWYADDSDSANSQDIFGTGSSTRTFPMPRVRPPITPAIDVWSLGVTFYCLIFGHTPFTGATATGETSTEFMLYLQICTQDWSPEETMGAERAATGGRRPRDKSSDGYFVIQLLDAMLQKNPKDRISISNLKHNPFILRDVLATKEWIKLTTPGDKSSSGIGSLVRKFIKLGN